MVDINKMYQSAKSEDRQHTNEFLEDTMDWWDWINFKGKIFRHHAAEYIKYNICMFPKVDFPLEMDGEFNFYRYFPDECQDEPPCNVVKMNMTK